MEPLEQVVVEFLIEFMCDQEEDNVRPLSYYLSRYPGYDEDIAREYLGLRTEAKKPGGSGSGSSRLRAQGLAEGSEIGRYRIRSEIGRGGQGVVYLAEDTELKRNVALKVLNVGAVSSDDVLIRFRREAEVASRLNHPAICTVFEVGADEGLAYIVMRYVEGQSLSSYIRSRSRPPATREEMNQLLDIFEKVGDGLDAAHEARVVHRDIKPGNVMVGKHGDAVILDFGLARDIDEDAPKLTVTGSIFGTPAYMSPEQISGVYRPLDRRTDVYSLGVTLFEALTHRLPFESPTVQGLTQLIRTAPIPDARRFNPAISRDLKVLLETALEKDLDRRYATASAFVEEIRRIRRNEPILARPAGPWLRLKRWASRNPRVATLTAVAAVVLPLALAVTWGVLERTRRHNREIETTNRQLLQMSDIRRVRDLLKRERSELHPIRQGLVDLADDWREEAEAVLRNHPDHERALETVRKRGRKMAEGWVYESEIDRWLEGLLSELVKDLEALADRVPPVLDRRSRASTLRRRSLDEPAEAWAACIASIKASDAYGSLEIEPQLGLVPLRRSPATGLWEFWHVESGERPVWNATRWPRDHWEEKDPDWDIDDGDWRMTASTGIVLILVPGGTYLQGMQGDARAFESAVQQEVTLAPFFLSKYEMTQGQWKRLHEGANPAWYQPETLHGTKWKRAREFTLVNPVENVSWLEAHEAMRRLDLDLPTEAQWEYGARAGTDSTWFTGHTGRSLDGFANVAGAEAREDRRPNPDQVWFDDDYPDSSPVGWFGPNPWGFFDIHGNVMEWCRDTFVSDYRTAPREGDGLRAGTAGRTERIIRGGSFATMAPGARSAVRYWQPPDQGRFDSGLRPARSLR